ncbi:MAG TPA: prephenate dehydrogenase/arogenate dehydrogenase family protein [Bryobacteraceae bacterium]|nr:prephenate dehydrogenase/arogenate dehydrogenase family protein [Bryobacteraceae bacterium]
MKTVAIFGVGLIGGSFALALRKAGFSGRIVGVSSPGTIRRALDLRVIDEGAPAEEAARSADLLYLAQPILRILEILPELDACVRADALITDAGSTKSAIVDRAAAVLSRGQFLGGHPMAGRERRGVEAAEADLFRGRPYVLTPRSPAELERTAAKELRGWIQRIGAVPMVLGPEEHDRIVAYTSHLPQLVATSLAALLEGRTEPRSGVFGPALVDSTRLALSPFDVWGDILATNRGAILEALGAYLAKLEEFRRDFEPALMRAQFDRASKLATYLRDTSQGTSQ